MPAERIAEVAALVACVLLAWRWRRDVRTWAWVDRAGAAVALVGLFVFARLVARLVVGALFVDWNGCRLAPTVALTRGYALYYPQTDGPILNTIYGPVAALAFLPVALFDTPTPVIVLGAALNLAFLVVPLLLFALRAGGRGADAELRAITGWLGVCFLMTAMAGPYYWLSMTHADTATLGLGLLACMALVPRGDAPEPDRRALAISAILATLSYWSKLTNLPLPVALLLFIVWAYGMRAARRYLLYLAIAAVVAVLLFLGVFGAEPMWFNLVGFPSRHPWYIAGLDGILWILGWMAKASAPAATLLGAAMLIRRIEHSTGGRVLSHAALVPLLPALFLVPTGVLGAIKIGGNANSFHSIYFLFAAGLAELVGEQRGAAVRSLARAAAHGLCVLGMVVAWGYGFANLRGPVPPIFPNPHQQAYDFARAHPNTAYFPWHPLASLLAEDRLYHFAYGVMDRKLGDAAPTQEHFHAYAPSQLRYVCVRDKDRKVAEYVPEFTEPQTSPELLGWTLLSRPGDTPP